MRASCEHKRRSASAQGRFRAADRSSLWLISLSASAATTPPCPCWQRARQSPGDCGLIYVTIGRSPDRRRQRRCSSIRRTEAASTRSGIWLDTAASFRRLPDGCGGSNGWSVDLLESARCEQSISAETTKGDRHAAGQNIRSKEGRPREESGRACQEGRRQGRRAGHRHAQTDRRRHWPRAHEICRRSRPRPCSAIW